MKLLTQLLICILLLVNSPRPTTATARQSPVRQEALSLSQIERLIKNPTPDNAIAIHIRKKGIKFRPDQEILNQLQKMGAGLKTIQALKAASEEKKGVEMTSNAAKPKLWVTYAWDNNKGGDFDSLVERLNSLCA